TAEEKRRGKKAGNKQHFWRYIDLSTDWRGGSIENNRYVITNLIQCQPDTLRFVPSTGEVDIFSLQEQVIASIVQSSIEQVAIEEAPKLLDPIQQTIATILRSYINSTVINRKEITLALQQLNQPQPGVYIKALRKAYEAFIATNHVNELLASVQHIAQIEKPSINTAIQERISLSREDLKLICFDYIWM
ncbi:MAG: helicase, partial [Ktedonobacteraceae bacterium]